MSYLYNSLCFPQNLKSIKEFSFLFKKIPTKGSISISTKPGMEISKFLDVTFLHWLCCFSAKWTVFQKCCQNEMPRLSHAMSYPLSEYGLLCLCHMKDCSNDGR